MGWQNIGPRDRRATGARLRAALFTACILPAMALGSGGQSVSEVAPTEAPSDSVGGPRFAVDALAVDLGELRKGEDGLARFTVTNTGDETLRILRVKPG
jgi:hypothetical protein